MEQRRFENYMFGLFSSMQQYMSTRPLVLGGIGGPGGGSGTPPGGIIGYLPQTNVAYDSTEAATYATPASGRSLVDNLNHIRARLYYLEYYQQTLKTVQEDDVTIASGITILNFEGDATVTDNGGGKVTITVTTSGQEGTSLAIQEDDAETAANVTVLNFEGFVDTFDEGGGKVTALIIPSLTIRKDTGFIASGVTDLNFEGSVSAIDDGGGTVTVTVTASGGSAHIIQENGTGLTNRAKLNFGSGLYAYDVGATLDRTTVTLSGFPRTLYVTHAGDLTSGIIEPRFYNVMGVDYHISKVYISVNSPGSGWPIIVDVLNNGSTIFSTPSNRPQISAGSNTGQTTVINDPNWDDGDYLQGSLAQVGSGASPGSDLTIHIIAQVKI